MTDAAIVGNRRIDRTRSGALAGSSGSRIETTSSPAATDRPGHEDPAKTLREVPPGKGFYFYLEEHAPTGVSAHSLGQFLDKLKSVELESIEFHLARGDFEKWITMLGDPVLAKQLRDLKDENAYGEELRAKLVRKVQSRYEALSKASTR